jgi:hypothetical protein
MSSETIFDYRLGCVLARWAAVGSGDAEAVNFRPVLERKYLCSGADCVGTATPLRPPTSVLRMAILLGRKRAL